MSEESRVSILIASQSYLTEHPEHPQYNYMGKHKINVQLPKDDMTDAQLQDFVKVVFKKNDLDHIVKMIVKLAGGKIRTEIKNQGNAAATRAPQVSSSIGKRWKQLVSLDGTLLQSTLNLTLATKMFANFKENADMFDLTPIQVENMARELTKLTALVGTVDTEEESGEEE